MAAREAARRERLLQSKRKVLVADDGLVGFTLHSNALLGKHVLLGCRVAHRPNCGRMEVQNQHERTHLKESNWLPAHSCLPFKVLVHYMPLSDAYPCQQLQD